MAVPVVQSYNSNTSAASASLTITKPTGLSVGDLLVAYITSISTSHSPQTPTNWSAQYAQQMINGNNNFYASCFTKVADSADVAASNFTFTTSVAVGGIGGTLLRVSGVAPGNEIEGISVSNDTDGNTTASFSTSSTPRMADSLLLAAFAKYDDGGSASGYASTPTKTWTEIVDIGFTVGGYDAQYCIASATAGSTDTITNFQTTLSSNTVGVTGSLLRINAVVNATGTNALFSISPLISTQNGTAGAIGTNALFSISPNISTQSGSATAPTQWISESKPSTTWTSET